MGETRKIKVDVTSKIGNETTYEIIKLLNVSWYLGIIGVLCMYTTFYYMKSYFKIEDAVMMMLGIYLLLTLVFGFIGNYFSFNIKHGTIEEKTGIYSKMQYIHVDKIKTDSWFHTFYYSIIENMNSKIHKFKKYNSGIEDSFIDNLYRKYGTKNHIAFCRYDLKYKRHSTLNFIFPIFYLFKFAEFVIVSEDEIIEESYGFISNDVKTYDGVFYTIEDDCVTFKMDFANIMRMFFEKYDRNKASFIVDKLISNNINFDKVMSVIHSNKFSLSKLEIKNNFPIFKDVPLIDCFNEQVFKEVCDSFLLDFKNNLLYKDIEYQDYKLKNMLDYNG